MVQLSFLRPAPGQSVYFCQPCHKEVVVLADTEPRNHPR